MPVTVNTALTEGVGDTRGVKKVEPEDVANEIVDALEVRRVDVFVPGSLKYTVAAGSLLPRRVREAIGRLMGVDKIMTEVPKSARRAYEERAAHSEPGSDEEQAKKPSAVGRDAA
jgi:hypothetical protein